MTPDHARQLRNDGQDAKGYDTEILVWGCVPLTRTARIICLDAASRERFEAEAKTAELEIDVVEEPAAFF